MKGALLSMVPPQAIGAEPCWGPMAASVEHGLGERAGDVFTTSHESLVEGCSRGAINPQHLKLTSAGQSRLLPPPERKLEQSHRAGSWKSVPPTRHPWHLMKHLYQYVR